MAKSNATTKKVSKTVSSTATATTAKEEQSLASDRQQMVAEAAYFIAEHRGFALGNEIGDWVQAEGEVDALLSA